MAGMTRKVRAEKAAAAGSTAAEVLAILFPTKEQPVKATPVVTTVETAEVPEFDMVTWLHDTAEARAARKATNAETVEFLKEKGIPYLSFRITATDGAYKSLVWEAAKKGERNTRTLKALAKKDAAAWAAEKATR